MFLLRVALNILRGLLKLCCSILLLPLLLLQGMLAFAGSALEIVSGILGGAFVLAGIAVLVTGGAISLAVGGMIFGCLIGILPAIISQGGIAAVEHLKCFIARI